MVLFNRQCFFFTVAIILTVYTFSASAVPAKDHKKKLLEKLRNSLNQTELEEASGDVAALEGVSEGVAVQEESQDTKAEEEETVDKSEEEDETTTEEKKTGEIEKASTVEKDNTELQKQDGPASYLRKNLGFTPIHIFPIRIIWEKGNFHRMIAYRTISLYIF